MSYKYRLLIGGIGDDAHSVGIRLLELGFLESGYLVKNLGIRNDIKDFFDYAHDFDIIMISNKNGHAELYLQDFPVHLSSFQLKNDDPKLWYLGGSLSVSESDFQIKKKFLRMGFTNVYPKPISFQQVLSEIETDIHRFEIPKKDTYSIEKKLTKPLAFDYNNVIDRQWHKEELQEMRKDILQEWHTGKKLLRGENGRVWKQESSLDQLLWSNKRRKGHALLQPRTGVADLTDQISLLKYLEKSGSSIASVQLDAASRSKKYDKARLGCEISRQRKKSVLNGFPIPIYEIEEVGKVVDSTNTPFQLRGGGPDHRFTYEIALGAGVSGLEGGFMCYLMPYDKSTNPVDSIRNWQYVDRLCALHEEQHQVHINREYFGVLTATLIEPSLAIIINIVQSLMSAQQGVKSISVGYAEQGNRIQDIAAIQVMDEMVNYYLKKFDYQECRVTTVFHQFMAAFPQDYEKAEELIFNSTISANLAGATKIMVKTVVEAFKIPSRYDNAKALKVCQKALLLAKDHRPNAQQLALEKHLLREQVRQIMEVIIELGNGSIAIGSLKAIEEGIIDIPWSPNIYNKNRLTAVRDADGAVRFHDFGSMPLNDEVKEFHKDKIQIRKNLERDASIFSLLEKDLSRIWKNDYKAWPLDGNYVT
ncbi:MAG: methylaspartate mutase subunit E [Bacteroidota bacterium]